MAEQDKFSSYTWNLEQLLVSQFRLLQKLIEMTQKERTALASESEAVMQLTEEKEIVLDQLGMVDDERRKLVGDMAMALNISGDFCTVGDLILHLKAEDASRISRIADGISTLVIQARELNEANQMLAHVKIDLIKATQAFLIGLAQPEINYRPAGVAPASREAPSWGVEIRA
ncbi:MAG: flagellar protein FlgN [Anaerolineaceae bacterium]|nr:flagellar protein FlgN [Anaerolineaceae bacterium]